MRSILGPRFFLGAVTLVVLGGLFSPSLFAESPWESLGQAIVENYEETAKPLFEESETKEKHSPDPFFDKMKKKQTKFTKEEQKRRREYIQKVRGKDWPTGKKQKKLSDFQRQQLSRRKEFAEKQREKIQKHQEEGS